MFQKDQQRFNERRFNFVLQKDVLQMPSEVPSISLGLTAEAFRRLFVDKPIVTLALDVAEEFFVSITKRPFGPMTT